MEDISGQHLTVKCNKVHFITARRDKNIVRNNIQENRPIFNQIRYIQEIGNKIISLLKKSSTPDHIGDVINSPLRSDWCVSIFSDCKKMEKFTTFGTPFLRSSLPPDTKILLPRISFRSKIIDIDNKYYLYSRTCEYGSSIFEGFLSLSHTHHCLALDPFLSSYQFHLNKA